MGAAQSFSASDDVPPPVEVQPAVVPAVAGAQCKAEGNDNDASAAALSLEVQRLRAENQRLRAAHAALDLVERSRVSEAHVEAFVERIVANEATNIPGLPDAWERALEKKAILIALTAATEAISNMRVDNILGHRIRFVVEPMSDEEVAAIQHGPLGGAHASNGPRGAQTRTLNADVDHADHAPAKRKRRRHRHPK